MSDDDSKLWKEEVKDVKKLSTDKLNSKISKPKEIIIHDFINSSPDFNLPKFDKMHFIGDRSGTGRKTQNKIKSGELFIEAKLDLHGYSIDEAFKQFAKFIDFCYHNQKRMLLVITGKGLKSDEGVSKLKSELPNWINNEQIRNKILRYTMASRKHGGEGAFYIFLRRMKDNL